MNYKKAYEDLVEKFEQYKNESIKWSIEDFMWQEKEGWQISKEQAQEALERMIYKHDANEGINWYTVDFWYEQYGEKVEEGKEAWREYIKEYEE